MTVIKGRASFVHARYLPNPFKHVFFFPKRSDLGPCEKATLTKKVVALLGPFWDLLVALASHPKKQGPPPKCRKRGVGVDGPVFHLFFFKKRMFLEPA